VFAHVLSAADVVVVNDTIAAMLTRLVATVRAKRLTSQLMDELRGVVVAEAFFVVLFNARPSMPVGIFVRSMIPPCDKARAVRHPVATIER
jgi:hypothetical protein